MPAPLPQKRPQRSYDRFRKKKGAHGQLTLPLRFERRARSADIAALRERTKTLSRIYENERRYNPTDAIETREDLEQAQRELGDMERARKERAKTVFAKRKRALAERAKRPAEGPAKADFRQQKARDAFFDTIVGDRQFNGTLNEAMKRLSLKLRKTVKAPSYTPLFMNKDPERRPEGRRTQFSEQKYAQAVADAAKVYGGQAAFYEGLLAEMKKALPDDAATKAYEQQLARLNRRTAR